jgi:AcrR family transcriptional regulator
MRDIELITPSRSARVRVGSSRNRILDGALAALSRRGARQLSMTDVGEAAGVSRPTLYRYFSTKQELLAALAEHITANFCEGIKKAADRESDCGEKLRAVLRFMIAYTAQVKADRILEIEPSFILRSLQTHFASHLAAVIDALEPVFAAFEARLGTRLNRALFSELLLRAQESTSLIPATPTWNSLPDVLANAATAFLHASASTPRKRPSIRPAAQRRSSPRSRSR